MSATIDLAPFIQWLPIALFLLLGYLVREMWEHIKSLKSQATLNTETFTKQIASVRQDLSDTQVDLAKNYVSYERFQDFRREVLEVMHRVEDKIDSKL